MFLISQLNSIFPRDSSCNIYINTVNKFQHYKIDIVLVKELYKNILFE